MKLEGGDDMASWTRPAGAKIIVHLSDLHFGIPQKQDGQDVWKTVAKFITNTIKPDLLLVSGDLANTPKVEQYEDANDALVAMNVPFVVCPGNHDRHFWGNRVVRWFKRDKSAHFDRVFGGKVALHDKILRKDLGKFKIGIVGVDTASNADFFARGYVRRLELDDVVNTANEGTTLDLVVALIHHHPLPIRKLEERRKGKAKSLAAVTSLVNSGTLLEDLAKANVDLILHGHEHAESWARYGTLEGARGEVHILGAGSATGTSSTKGWSLDEVSFNAILLHEDRSASVRVVCYDGGWRVREELPLFDSSAARKLRLHRSVFKERTTTELDSEILKITEFTPERDIRVSWQLTRWTPGDVWQYPLENSTGMPINPTLQITSQTGNKLRLTPNIKTHATKTDAYYMEADVPPSHQTRESTVEMSFVWRAGALLTRSEMNAVTAQRASGLLRSEGLEFTGIEVFAGVARATLLLLLPRRFRPETVSVRVFDKERNAVDDEAREMQERVRTLDGGGYVLAIPYPREQWIYALAWRPVEPALSAEAQRFSEVARARGDELVSYFVRTLSEAGLEHASASLYVPDGSEFVRTGWSGADAEPPTQVPAAGDLSPLGQAWWGLPIEVREGPGATTVGLLAGEAVFWALPVIPGAYWASRQPLGVLRVAMSSFVERPDWIERVFELGIARMLTNALGGLRL